jgi:hypothetical protein
VLCHGDGDRGHDEGDDDAAPAEEAPPSFSPALGGVKRS